MTATSAIRYRVVDFLKQYPPFQSMSEDDLLDLAARGRVRFHEADEYLYWQGQPHGAFFLVIQQGTVSLWEDSGGGEQLRDIRGPGDLLAIDGFLGSTSYLSSAKANCDVLLYALETADLRPLLERYPSAARYVAAHASVMASDVASDSRRRAHELFVHEAIRHGAPAVCHPEDAVRTVARQLAASGAKAVAAIDSEGRFVGVLTTSRLLRWMGDGQAGPDEPVSGLLDRTPPTVAPEATVDECLLAAARARAEVVAVTEGGAAASRLHGLITAADLAPAFGEQPLELLGAIERAASPEALQALNQRARSFLLEQATTPAAVDWLAELATLVDKAVVGRALSLAGLPNGDSAGPQAAWFLFGSCGRGESITARLPQLGLVFEESGPAEIFVEQLRRASGVLGACGYLPREDLSDADARFRCASVGEWERRFLGWIRDPVGAQLYRARPMFDMRVLFGQASLVEGLQAVVVGEVAMNDDFLRVLAHDCLGNLPPLSFFRDLVVEETGEQDAVLRIERSALRPLVDVGRVFGLASGRVFGASTLDRLGAARARFSDHESVFRDAAETLRVMLYHQARSGLRRRDAGTEIPPGSVSHHDRRVLKTGFRSILRILEFTGECRWLTPS